MMAKTAGALEYLLRHYPHKDELSNARSTKMLYLADWKHCIDHGKQITPIAWHFDNYGPFVWDVYHAAMSRPTVFEVRETTNMHGGKKVEFRARGGLIEPEISESEQASIDHVIEQTKDLYWDRFIKLVYSTYPIVNSARYSELDLPALAIQYKKSTDG